MFSIHTTRGAISIILADIIISCLVFEFFFFVLPEPPDILIAVSFQEYLTLSIFTLAIIFSFSITNLYSFMDYVYPVEMFKMMFFAFLISCGYIVAFGFFINSLILINWRLLPPLSTAFVFLFFFHYIVFYGMPKNRKQILILGANDLTREIIKGSQVKFRGYEIAGIVTTMENQVGTDFQGVSVVGLMEQIKEVLQSIPAINIVVITLRDRRGKLPIRDLLKLKTGGVKIIEGSSFYEEIKHKIIIDDFLKPSWFVFEEGFCQSSLHRTIKRTQGIIISFCLLTIFFPVLLLTALLIKLDSPGPVFYRQKRIGLNGKVFRLFKFRSMRIGAEAMSGPIFTQKHDPRITRVGRVIRKLRLDEVPQFINILKGDMDMVGPRPERPVFVKELQELIPYYILRHTVNPGLTGWAQVNYSYGDSLEDSKEKLQYDLYYIKHGSWFMDLFIIILTVKVVLCARGR